MTDSFALDSNILVYLHEQNANSPKRIIAQQLIVDNPVISPQVISEYLNVCRKRLGMDKEGAVDALLQWLPYTVLSDFSGEVYENAKKLIKRYQFQLFDAIVVSYTLASRCTILYSEEMDHNLLVEKRLRIVNPFI